MSARLRQRIRATATIRPHTLGIEARWLDDLNLSNEKWSDICLAQGILPRRDVMIVAFGLAA
jgi:hypothetical protein